MRLLPFVSAVLLLGCGGSAESVPADDAQGSPATPLPRPSGTAAPPRGPAGFVTMFSIDDTFIADARFVEDATLLPSSPAGAGGCFVTGAAGHAAKGISAGTISVSVPTRDGERSVDLLFDRTAGEYELGTLDGRAEPGGVLRIRAEGDRVPAFDVEMRAAANIVFDAPDVLELDAVAPRDVTLSWTTEGGNDEVFVDLSLGDASVSCFFDASAGTRTGTIPAALVADVVEKAPAECTPATCLLYLSSKHTERASAGDVPIVLAHGIATFKEVRVVR